MTDLPREARLMRLLVTLADTLTAEYDVIELLDTLVTESVGVLEVDAGGLMLSDPSENGALRLVVSTDEAADAVELQQLVAGEGPCIESYTSGRPVSVGDIGATVEHWPVFAASALRCGFQSMHAYPLRLRGSVIGAMNLFGASLGTLTERDIVAGQALADVATIGILQQKLVHDQAVLTDQLQHALGSRVVIEQAKGVIAEHAGIGMDEAFATLRGYARTNGRRLAEVADRSLRLPTRTPHQAKLPAAPP